MDRATSGVTGALNSALMNALAGMPDGAINDNYVRQLAEIKSRRKWTDSPGSQATALPLRYAHQNTFSEVVMKPTTVSTLRQWKKSGRKFASVTAYDYSFARLFADEGIQVMLVGDSLGMVVQGHDSTLPVTLADIAYHTRAVRRGAPAALLMADLPFMTFATPEQAFASSAELMRAGANMVKIEGGAWLSDTVRQLAERAVPVCGHLGLTPQSVNIFGGYKVQGRDSEAAETLLADALALEAAGAQMLVLECVPVALAQRVTEALAIPVIGIGAGNVTDGQILVMHDAFGITGGHIPKFVKNFLLETGEMRAAVRQYVAEVEAGTYPAEEHSFY